MWQVILHFGGLILINYYWPPALLPDLQKRSPSLTASDWLCVMGQLGAALAQSIYNSRILSQDPLESFLSLNTRKAIRYLDC
jgi:hypothetical protein